MSPGKWLQGAATPHSPGPQQPCPGAEALQRVDLPSALRYSVTNERKLAQDSLLMFAFSPGKTGFNDPGNLLAGIIHEDVRECVSPLADPAGSLILEERTESFLNVQSPVQKIP